MKESNENTENKTYVVIKHTDSYYRDTSHRDASTTFCYQMHHYAWVVATGTLEECQKYLFDVAADSSDDVCHVDEAVIEDIQKDIEEARADGEERDDFNYQGEGLYKYGELFFKFGEMNFEDDLRYYNIMEVEEAYNYYEDAYGIGADFIAVLPSDIDTSFYVPEETENKEDEDNES